MCGEPYRWRGVWVHLSYDEQAPTDDMLKLLHAPEPQPEPVGQAAVVIPDAAVGERPKRTRRRPDFLSPTTF